MDTGVALNLTLEPFQSPLVISQQGLQLLQALAIVILYPLQLTTAECFIFDHLALNGDTGKSLKAKPGALLVGLHSPHEKGRFDTDTPFFGEVYGQRSVAASEKHTRRGRPTETRFVRNHIPGNKRGIA
jgi:hypothetical protein